MCGACVRSLADPCSEPDPAGGILKLDEVPLCPVWRLRPRLAVGLDCLLLHASSGGLAPVRWKIADAEALFVCSSSLSLP